MNSTTTQKRTDKVTRSSKTAVAIAIPVLTATAVLAPIMGVAASAATVPASEQSIESAPQSRVSHFSGGGTTIHGKKWLKGKGVNVYRSRQCTELASRLYAQKGWGSLNNIYGMRTNRVYDKKLTFHRNGSGYVPVPGDVLVELGGSYQHVAVVNKVTKKGIHTVEQNAMPNGRHYYPFKGNGPKKKAYGAFGVRHVGGFIHSKKNKNTN